MNPGGEPERDDTGLPPVDIEIPDDARELDRDVQAYRRELRALRRSSRRGRLHRSLSKDGVVLPLLACCLILALITGTLLTVFTATSNPSLTGLPGSASSPSAGPTTPHADMVSNQSLPDATVAVDGAAVSVRALRPVVLVLVPTPCDCAATIMWLAEIASNAGVPEYLIYSTPTAQTEVNSLVGNLPSQLRSNVQIAAETDNVLSPATFPAGIPADQLAAILVGPNSSVTWVSRMSPRDSQAPLIRVLKGTQA